MNFNTKIDYLLFNFVNVFIFYANYLIQLTGKYCHIKVDKIFTDINGQKKTSDRTGNLFDFIILFNKYSAGLNPL